MKRLIGIIFLIAGIILILFGYYEKGQINMKAQQANESVEQGQSVFQENPIGKAVGSVVGESAQQQISEKVAHYQQMVMWIMIIGGVIGVIGIGMILSCGCKKQR